MKYYTGGGVLIYTIHSEKHDFYVLLGRDLYDNNTLTIQMGGIDGNKHDFSELRKTAQRELYEETAKTLHIPLELFKKSNLVDIKEYKSGIFIIFVEYNFLNEKINKMYDNFFKIKYSDEPDKEKYLEQYYWKLYKLDNIFDKSPDYRQTKNSKGMDFGRFYFTLNKYKDDILSHII